MVPDDPLLIKLIGQEKDGDRRQAVSLCTWNKCKGDRSKLAVGLFYWRKNELETTRLDNMCC